MSGRVIAAGVYLQGRIVFAQPTGQRLSGSGVHVKQADGRNAGCSQRSCNGRTHTACACHQHACALQLDTFAQHAAHKALTVKHIALQLPLRPQAHCVAGARNGGCG